MEELKNLQALYKQGYLGKQEFDERRLQIIDNMTNTSGQKKAAAPPQPRLEINGPAPVPDSISLNPENSVYANRHFMHTNVNSLKEAEYLIVTPPTPYNNHLFNAGKQPLVPFSINGGNTTPIDPDRGKRKEEIQHKKYGTTEVIFKSEKPGAQNADEMVNRLEQDRRKLGWELFVAAQVNDVAKIKELLDRGADPNQRDFDTEGTPVHTAASKGQKHAVYYLVERGGRVNTQNFRGESPLHEAVKFRFNEVALWLVKRGADIHLENYRGHSPYDMALPWLQKEMKDTYETYLKEQKQKRTDAKADPVLEEALAKAAAGSNPNVGLLRKEQLKAKQQVLPQEAAEFEQKFGAPVTKLTIKHEGNEDNVEPIVQEVMKIYLKNGSYKSIVVNNTTTAKDLIDLVCEKLSLQNLANHMEVIEHQKVKDLRVELNINIYNIKKEWIHTLGADADHARFIVQPKRAAPESVVALYRDAIYGDQA